MTGLGACSTALGGAKCTLNCQRIDSWPLLLTHTFFSRPARRHRHSIQQDAVICHLPSVISHSGMDLQTVGSYYR